MGILNYLFGPSEREHQVADTYLAYRKQGYNKQSACHLTARELIMSPACVADILSYMIISKDGNPSRDGFTKF